MQPLNSWLTPHNKLVSSKYDNLFKAIISAGWNVKSDGHVEAPTGHFAIVEIPKHYSDEYYEMVLAVEDGEPIEMDWSVDEGWYLCRENSDGILVATKGDKSEIENYFAVLATEYAAWDAD